MASEVDTELELLRRFANTSLRKGSFIYEKVNDLLAQAAREKARLMVAAASTPPSDSIVVRLRINIAGFNELRSVEIKKGSTMESLKRSIETVTGTGYSAERVQSKRTGMAWGTFDTKSIEQCEIKNNDELVVDFKNLNENLNPKGLERIRTSNLTPQSIFQFVALALHAYVLDEDFITVTELPNTTPGFAPSLKELPKGTLLPNNWNASPSTVAAMYKHKSKPGKQFQLMMVEIDAATMMVTFAQKGGDTHSREISHAQYEPSFQSFSTEGTDVANVQGLKESIVQPLVYALLPNLLAAKQAAATATSSAGAMDVSSSSSSSSSSAGAGVGSGVGAHPGASAPRTELPPALGGRGGPLGPLGGGVGSGDLDPFPGGVRIGGSGNYGPGGFAGPDGGNLVGPNHPLFSPGGGFGSDGGGDFGGGYGGYGGVPGFGGPGYGGRGLPQPRFDPFGPVIGPNTDIGGAGAGDVGVDSRGRRIPQIPGLPGQPRGPPGRARVPGEPQPDHLRPPGW